MKGSSRIPRLCIVTLSRRREDRHLPWREQLNRGPRGPLRLTEKTGGRKGQSHPPRRGPRRNRRSPLLCSGTVLAEERERDRAHLAQSLASVQGDVTVMQGKVQAVEAIVTQQVQDTVRALDRVTKNYDCQAQALQEVRDAQAQLEMRLTSLETKPPSSVAAGSTVDTEGGRKPALIIGGWHPDQAAEDTLKAAKEVLRTLDVPLNGDDSICAGGQARLCDLAHYAQALRGRGRTQTTSAGGHPEGQEREHHARQE